jgi:hypothetical protein
MFFFFVGFICGIVLVQEVPTIPKLRPYFDTIWNKIKDNGNNVSGGNDNISREGSKDD